MTHITHTKSIIHSFPFILLFLLSFVAFSSLHSTALHKAIETCNFSNVNNVLSKSSKNINTPLNSRKKNLQDKNGMPPLHLACFIGCSKKLILLLIKNGATVNQHIIHENNPYNGAAPLHLATLTKNSMVIETLLTNNAEPHIRDALGRTPLHYLVLSDNPGYKRIEKITTTIKVSSENWDDPDDAGNTPLLFATAEGKSELASSFIEQGASVTVTNELGHTPLHYALTTCTRDVTILLLTKGASVTIKDLSDTSPLNMLIDTNTSGTSGDEKQQLIELFLFHAVTTGDAHAIRQLAENGTSLDMTDEHGNTPLHRAVSNGQLDSITALIESGANTTLGNSSGATPFKQAQALNKVGIIKGKFCSTTVNRGLSEP